MVDGRQDLVSSGESGKALAKIRPGCRQVNRRWVGKPPGGLDYLGGWKRPLNRPWRKAFSLDRLDPRQKRSVRPGRGLSASASSGPCRVPRGCLKVAIDLPGCQLLDLAQIDRQDLSGKVAPNNAYLPARPIPGRRGRSMRGPE